MTNEVTDADSDVEQASGSAAGSTVSRDSVTGATSSFNRANQDVGADEAQSRGIVGDSHNWAQNAKRTYDEYQDLALTAARRSQERFDDTMADVSILRKNAIKHFSNLDEITLSRLSNGVNNDELAVDRKWNVDEQGYVVEAILRSDVYKEALAAAVAQAAVSNKE